MNTRTKLDETISFLVRFWGCIGAIPLSQQMEVIYYFLRLYLYVCVLRSLDQRGTVRSFEDVPVVWYKGLCVYGIFVVVCFCLVWCATHISHPVKRSIANSWRFRCPFYCTIWRFCGKLFPFHFRFRRVVARFSSPCLLLMQERFHGLGTVNEVIRRNSILLPSR